MCPCIHPFFFMYRIQGDFGYRAIVLPRVHIEHKCNTWYARKSTDETLYYWTLWMRMQYKMPAPQFKRQDLIFLILPNEGEIFNIPKYSRWGQNARHWSRKEMSVQNSLHTGKRSNWCSNLIHSPAKRLQSAKSCKIEWTSLLYYIFSFVQQFSIFRIDFHCSVKFNRAQHEVFSCSSV